MAFSPIEGGPIAQGGPFIMIARFFRTVMPALAAIALLAGTGLAQEAPMPGPGDMPPPHHHWMHHGMCHGPMDGIGMPIPMLLKAAKLTDAQKAQIKQLFKGRRAQMKTQFEQLKTARDQIAGRLLAPGTVNASDLSSQLQQMTAVRGQMAQARLQDMVAIHNLLTSDQIAAVAQARSDFQQKMAAMKSQCKLKHGDASPPADHPAK
ncbi:MAG: Spy/CpxP family protein refolding chaperone [Candidatus Binataceae bacterium]